MKDCLEKRNNEVMIETNIELLPCPFCGGEAEIVHSTENDPPCHYDAVRVRCKNCHASTEKRISDGYYGMYCDDETVSKLWNNRVYPLRFTQIPGPDDDLMLHDLKGGE